MERQWIFASDSANGETSIDWDQICGLPCILALLKRKDFRDANEVENFLRPRLASLGDPFALDGMATAVDRIFRAIDSRERVVLFGDYDVDGVASLALLHTMLKAYGLDAGLFLPLRVEEGYGLSRESVERCCEEHRPDLLIAVDCGTSSIAEIASLCERNIDVIVFDHHEPKHELPKCVAVVNPKANGASELDYLCSAGVIFKLCHALLKRRPLPDFDLRSHLDLVALATVADIVPIHRENRLFVQRGAHEIARSRRPGLRNLLDVAAVEPPVAAYDIGFKIGPRLNAAGRLATAQTALRLLLTDDEEEARRLAQFLDAQNRERRAVEKQVFESALEKVRRDYRPERDAAIVVGAREWHPGVVGIVSSRLTKMFCRPSIVVAFDDGGSGKGSCRSIEGFSIADALKRCGGHLERHGGHAMAAGLTVREEKFETFANDFRTVAREMLSDEQLRPCLQLDHEITFRELNGDLFAWHQMLEPFGSGNPQPVFFARNVVNAMPPQILKEKHLKLRLRQDQFAQRAIFFDGALETLPPEPWDVAFRLTRDTYEGETRQQMQVLAIRSAAGRE